MYSQLSESFKPTLDYEIKADLGANLSQIIAWLYDFTLFDVHNYFMQIFIFFVHEFGRGSVLQNILWNIAH